MTSIEVGDVFVHNEDIDFKYQIITKLENDNFEVYDFDMLYVVSTSSLLENFTKELNND